MNALGFLCLRDARLTALQSTQILNLSSSFLLFSRNALKNDSEELKSRIFVWQSSPECHHHHHHHICRCHQNVIWRCGANGANGATTMERLVRTSNTQCAPTRTVCITHITHLSVRRTYTNTAVRRFENMWLCSFVKATTHSSSMLLCTLLIYYTYGSTIQWYMTMARFK